MNAIPALIQHDLDKQTIEEINDLRIVRLGIAEKQLKNIKETAQRISQQDGFQDSDNNDILVMQLRIQLVKKINMLKERVKNPEVLFPDELAQYLEIANERPDED